jgi:serine/threonine protein kinase/WD40 repeat protein
MSDPNPSLEEFLFEAALAKSSTVERDAFLDSVCSGNPALRSRLNLLLEGHFGGPAFLTTEPKKIEQQTAQPRVEDEAASNFVGRYKLLEKIGEGGFGEVWMAEQKEPVKRRVALKIIKLGMDTKQVVARFEAERQALALMDHPNIAKVFDGGATATGRPYFVMELVRGERITDYCDQNQLTTEGRLKLFMQVCHAVQHAHQKGIIHRDLKPSNILVTTQDGAPTIKVIDFGIAKATRQELTDKTVFTQFRQFLGTPAYISPEQAEMSGGDVDTRSDIYSLGVLLYELLTGRTPFDSSQLLAAGLDELRRTIREVEPARPSTRLSAMTSQDLTTTAQRRGAAPPKLISLMRGDLDWIVMKCLRKEPPRRYETAHGLARDLERHLRDEPVMARPPSRIYQFQKTVRRNKLVFAAGAVVLATLSAAVVVSRLEAMRARRVELAARQRAYAAEMKDAKQALDKNNLGRAVDLLDAQRPKPGQQDLRGWEWRYLWQQTRSDALFTLCQRPSSISSLAVSSDGALLAIGAAGKGGLSLWDLARRRELAHLAEQEQWIRAVFSPAEPLLAFTGFNPSAPDGHQSTLHFWEVANQTVAAEFPLEEQCKGLAFSADGKRLITSTVEGHITLRRVPDGTVLASFPVNQSEPDVATAFAASSNLTLVACGLNEPWLHLIQLPSGNNPWPDIRLKDRITALAFSADQQILAGAASFSESDIYLWEVTTGREIGRLHGHDSWVSALVFWPDGKKLASSSADQTIRIWDLPTRRCLAVLRGHRQPVFRLKLLPDNKTLVSGSKDGTVCFWDTSTPRDRPPRITFPEGVAAWCFEPGSQTVLTLNWQGQVTRWTGAEFQTPERLLTVGTNLANNFSFHHFSLTGRFLAVGSGEGIVKVWDVARRAQRIQLTSTHKDVRARGFLPDENELVTFSFDGFYQEWNLATGTEIQSWRAPLLDDASWAFSAHGRVGAAMGRNGDLVIRNLREHRNLTVHLEVEEAVDLGFSPDSKFLAVASDGGYVRIWDAAAWQTRATLLGFPRYVSAVAFCDDRRLAAGADGKDALTLWDTSSWLNVLTLEGDGAQFVTTACSPDGNTLGALNRKGILHLWRASSWPEIEAAERFQPEHR